MRILFENVINPRSVAIIGASDDMGKFGGRIIGYLLMHNFRGKIYPINRKRETVRVYHFNILESKHPRDGGLEQVTPSY